MDCIYYGSDTIHKLSSKHFISCFVCTVQDVTMHNGNDSI